MARTPSSGQAVIELVYATLFFMTVFSLVVSLLGNSEKTLKQRQFRTKETSKWIDSRD